MAITTFPGLDGSTGKGEQMRSGSSCVVGDMRSQGVPLVIDAISLRMLCCKKEVSYGANWIFKKKYFSESNERGKRLCENIAWASYTQQVHLLRTQYVQNVIHKFFLTFTHSWTVIFFTYIHSFSDSFPIQGILSRVPCAIQAGPRWLSILCITVYVC